MHLVFMNNNIIREKNMKVTRWNYNGNFIFNKFQIIKANVEKPIQNDVSLLKTWH